jgi:hypothetical protein
MEIELAYPSGVAALVRTSMTAAELDFSCRIVGSSGEAYAPSFVLPHLDDRVLITKDGEQRVHEMGKRSSYTYQLEAFTDELRNLDITSTGAEEAVANAELIDAAYLAAGFSPRPRSPHPVG